MTEKYTVSQQLKDFITQPHILELLDNNMLSEVYEIHSRSTSPISVRDLTTLLILTDFDVLHNVRIVPDFFLYGKLSAHLKEYLQDLYIPDNVQGIGYAAFKHCRYLEKIHLPSSIKFLSKESLKAIDLKEIYFDGTVDQWKHIRKEDNWCNKSKLERIILLDRVIDFTED